MKPLDASAKLTVSPDVVSASVGSETVLLHTRSGEYFVLEGVASDVWELLKGCRSLAELHATLSPQFVVPSEALWNDLRGFCDRLLATELITSDAA